MARPNIVGSKKIYGRTKQVLLSSSGTPTDILENSAGSGYVYKVNGLRLVNFDGAVNYDGTVKLYTALDTLTGFFFYGTVPFKAAQQAMTKDEIQYLEEGDKLFGFGSTADKLWAIINFEAITDVP